MGRRRRYSSEVYVIGPVDGCHKIGRSMCPQGRLTGLNLPSDPQIVCTISGNRSSWLERYLHRAFGHRRTNGEWFRLTDEEISLIASVPSAELVRDLPPAIIALHKQNAPPRRRWHKRKPKGPVRSIQVYERTALAMSLLSIELNVHVADLFERFFQKKLKSVWGAFQESGKGLFAEEPCESEVV
jgi:hypothetical protein